MLSQKYVRRTSTKWIGQFWEMDLRWLAKNRCSFWDKKRFPQLKWKSSKLSYKFETAVHPTFEKIEVKLRTCLLHS